MELLGGYRWYEDVLDSRGDQGGHVQAREPSPRIVAGDGFSLTGQSHEARLVRIVERALNPELDEVGPLCEGLPGEEPGQREAHELVDVAPGLDAQEAPDQKAAVVVDPRRRAVELERRDAPRMPEGQLLGDHAAHGCAADVRGGQAEGAHQVRAGVPARR